jgi:hypothetical protein
MLFAFALAVVLSLLLTPVQAQDVYSVAYFAGGNTSQGRPAVQGTVRVVNPGTTFDFLCADIYVFDPHEELKECCSCPVSENGLLTIPLSDLTDNPANGRFTTTGVIKIVSDQYPNCDAANPVPTPTLRSWITNPNARNVTEAEFEDAPLSQQELFQLGLQCSFIPNQSGPGVCRCGDFD